MAQDLSWNYLRLNSAVEIGKAVRYNQTLTYLNLEYNGFGTQGAEELGTSLVLSLSKDTKSSVAVKGQSTFTSSGGPLRWAALCVLSGMSLFFNSTLKKLNLANNNVTSRGAFVIAVALKQNKTLR